MTPASSSFRSQKATVASLSVFEKLDLIPAVGTIVGNALTALITGLLYTKTKRPATYFKHVALTVLRTLMVRTSPRQQHYIFPPTDEAYLAICKKQGVPPKSVTLEDGTTAHWIGSTSADKLILNFHGGGYVIPASRAFFEFFFQVVSTCNAAGKSTSCLFLAYDLAPGAQYPRQLQQSAFLMNYVLQTLKISPNNIIITGDSAGANLAIALLSHMAHPHPSVSLPVPNVSLSSPILGIVLISPWVSFDTTCDSFQRNKYKDCIAPGAGMQWSEAFMGCKWPHTDKTDYYNQPITAEELWWSGWRDLVTSVLIVAAADELLIDVIKVWEGKLSKGLGDVGTPVEFVAVEGEYHDQASLDLQLGYTEANEGKQAKLIKSWIAAKF